MMIKRNKKSNLDEMQEQKLLQIEHNGYNIAFWGLVISILVQSVIFDHSPKATIGETVILLVMCSYTVVSCLKNGIWDRKLKADNKTNMIASTIAGAVMGGVYGITSYVKYKKPMGSVATFLIMFLIIFGLCLVSLTISAKIYKKKLKDIDDKLE